jgi:hypothetical protein
VPDADWARNRLISMQAFVCCDVLKRYGVAGAAVAASPEATPEAKGIDDHLAAGGTVGDMVVLERVESEGLHDWIDATRADRALGDVRARDRLVDLVRFWSLVADKDGWVVKPSDAFCRYVPSLGSPSRIDRGMQWLEGCDDDYRNPFVEIGAAWAWQAEQFVWSARLRDDLRSDTVSHTLSGGSSSTP